MAGPTIVKSPSAFTVAPNLGDYERVPASFSWAEAWRELAGLPDSRGLNIAQEAIDRHAAGPRRDHLALRWLGKSGAPASDASSWAASLRASSRSPRARS